MNDDLMKDILARQAEDVNEREPVLSLFSVAKRAKRALVPVSPSPAFRARLSDGLRMAAHHQQAHLMLANKPNEHGWGWIIGAAAIGSAAGIIAFALRMRSHTQRVLQSTNAEAK